RLSSTAPSTRHPCTLSLHDALPISALSAVPAHIGLGRARSGAIPGEESARRRTHWRIVGSQRSPFPRQRVGDRAAVRPHAAAIEDRKSTRLNSSHVAISYAVFCLKK